jgi:hypothetical protein
LRDSGIANSNAQLLDQHPDRKKRVLDDQTSARARGASPPAPVKPRLQQKCGHDAAHVPAAVAVESASRRKSKLNYANFFPVAIRVKIRLKRHQLSRDKLPFAEHSKAFTHEDAIDVEKEEKSSL